MKDWLKLVISIIVCELAGLLGTPLTRNAISDWYIYLNKPAFSPPNWVFGPVWTLLYLLMGIAFYLIWQQGWQKQKIKKAGKLFLIQLLVNFLWSPIFFGLRFPLGGLVTIIVLWILIVKTIREFFPLSKVAAYLLIPYLLWVSFATALNLAIVVLN